MQAVSELEGAAADTSSAGSSSQPNLAPTRRYGRPQAPVPVKVVAGVAPQLLVLLATGEGLYARRQNDAGVRCQAPLPLVAPRRADASVARVCQALDILAIGGHLQSKHLHCSAPDCCTAGADPSNTVPRPSLAGALPVPVATSFGIVRIGRVARWQAAFVLTHPPQKVVHVGLAVPTAAHWVKA